VIARHTITVGKEEEVLPLYSQLAAASQGEPGNISFLAYRQLDDGRDIVLLERSASKDAFEEHRRTTPFQRARPRSDRSPAR
jgi:quinol monooxygenase YgiN